MDVNTKSLIKNAYRITRRRGLTALRLRVPGGHLPARHLETIQRIADRFGDGTVHVTTRQGFEIPGIPMTDIEAVNREAAPLIRELEQSIGVKMDDPEKGYPAAGTRNVSACIGNRVCQFANTDTTALARKIEALIYPNHYHVKIAVSGCPNDCIKARMQDLGILSLVHPLQDRERCVGCLACVNICQSRSTGALRFVNYQVKREAARCIGCGECILSCPALSWSRGEKFYRLLVMGRTGKKDPRMAQTFINWIREEPMLNIIANMYRYIERHIDTGLDKEHVGYIMDRTGYKVFRDTVLKGVTLNPGAEVADRLEFKGSPYVLPAGPSHPEKLGRGERSA